MNFLRKAGQTINRSIQRRLVIWTTVFWVISVSILSLTLILTSQYRMIRQANQRNTQFASIVSWNVNIQMSGIASDVRLFADHLQTLPSGPENIAAALLSLRLASPQRYHAAYYFDASGALLFHITEAVEELSQLSVSEVLSRPPAAVPEGAAAARRLTAGALYFSGIDFTGTDGIPVIYLGIPAAPETASGNTVVLVLDINSIWQNIYLMTIGQSGITYMVDAGGNMIAHPDRAYLGRPMPALLAPLLQGETGYAEYTEPFRKHQVLSAYCPVGGDTGWGVVIQQDKAEAYAAVRDTVALSIVVWSILAAAGAVGIIIAARKFTRPIVDLTRTVEYIARTGELARTGMSRNTDEVGQLSRAFDGMIDKLGTAQNEIKRAQEARAQAAADERTRLARDLHDAVSQTLFSASLIAEVLPRIWEKDPEEGRRRLEEIRRQTKGALAEMRTLLFELRPAALADAELGDLLRQLAEGVAGRTGIPVTTRFTGQGRLPPDVKIAFYRIAQEALNNIAKHSGAARAQVELQYLPGRVTLDIRDDGRGFDIAGAKGNSLGLGIMQERARAAGAVISIQSTNGRGTAVTVDWQVSVEED
jgi:signal transduction histidine kinase